MSQFAAGCAICGADLHSARRRAASQLSFADRVDRLRPAWMGFDGARDSVLMGLVVGLVVLVSPLLGLLLAGWIAYSRDRGGDAFDRNVAIGLALVAVALIALPDTRYGVFHLLSS